MRPNGNIIQRGEGSFLIRYSTGNDPLTGKRIRVNVTFKGNYKEAQAEMRRLLRTLDTNEHVAPNKIKTSDFLNQWLETIKSKVSPRTFHRYAEIVTLHLIPAFGHSPLLKLEPLAVQQKYNDWERGLGARGRKGNKGLSPRTRLHLHRTLKLALKHAVKMRLIPSNPCDHIQAPVAKAAVIKTLSVEQSITLLNSLKKYPFYWPVFLALATGMRLGEIAALRWKNVDLERKTIRVVESVEQINREIRFKAPKTDRFRAVQLPAYAVEELKAWKKKQAETIGKNKITFNDDIFVCGRSEDGGVKKPLSFSGEFRRHIRRFPDLPTVRFHDLRHSHATQLLQEGVHPKIAQERLGHSTITTTLDLYSHVTKTMQEEAVLKLDEVYSAKRRDADMPEKGGNRPGLSQIVPK
jgi:integrase